VKCWATELRSLREKQIEGLNSSGFILLACINIEATTRKAMEVWILQFIEICLRILQMLVFEKRKRRGRERWGRKRVGERDWEENGQLCGEEKMGKKMKKKILKKNI
jgi:hypothetical protein